MSIQEHYEKEHDVDYIKGPTSDVIEICGQVADMDVVHLTLAEKSYGDSWKRRGGVGAFMMLARKWDRLENQVSRLGWDVFKACTEDTRPEGVIDDIRDLRRYLTLVEAELLRQERNGKIS
jgi:hypothetical protein